MTSRRRGARFASLITAVALAAVGAAGCSGADNAATATAAGERGTPAERATAVEALPVRRPQADHDGIPLDTPKGAYPLIWVRVHEQVKLRTEPGGGELVDEVGRNTDWGSTSAFGVVHQKDDWAAVSTPLLPNGQLAWVRLDEDRVRGGWTKMAVVVDVSERRGVMLRDGDPALSFPVTVGMPGADTPTGRFAVTDAFRGGLNPAYGCCALALSATQPHLPSGWWGGSRIAIHGTYGELGVAASHGCVRAADEVVAELTRHVPVGAPVFIRG
jgi:lipoprotein-anchoring transpeptidase ErfK/SrfK